MAQQSDGLHPVLMGLSWMIGRWQGTGKASYPGTDDVHAVRPLSMETGFWRPQPDGSLEVVMCHPSGYAEVWYGRITGPKVELATDAVVRTASAEDYSAGQRLYGNVEGDLLWTFDKAAAGQPLQSHMWARLRRV